MASRYALVVESTYGNDEVTEKTHEYSEKEFKLLKPVLERIVVALDKNGGEWFSCDVGNSRKDYIENGDLSVEDADFLSSIVPSADHGTYSVESITTYKFSQKERIY